MDKTIFTPAKILLYIKENFRAKQLILPEYMYCTHNFSWNEVLKTKTRKIPVPEHEILENLKSITEILQLYKDLINNPIKITSSWRTPQEQNNLILQHKQGILKNKPSQTSLHLEGLALDFVVLNSTQNNIQKLIDTSFIGECEFGKDYTHIGLTTFSKPYLIRNNLCQDKFYKKKNIYKINPTQSELKIINKRINPINWQSLKSEFDCGKNGKLFD